MAENQEPRPSASPEPPQPPSLVAFPAEILEMIFRSVVDYEPWDRGPLRKRTSQYFTDLTNLARVCRKFYQVMHTVLYKHVEFYLPLRSLNHARLYTRMEMLRDLFRQHRNLSEDVSAITFNLPRRSSFDEAARYVATVEAILLNIAGQLTRARVALPARREQDVQLVPIPLALNAPRVRGTLQGLTHLVVELPTPAIHDWTFDVHGGLTAEFVSWAPRIHTLVLRDLSTSALSSLFTTTQAPPNLTVLEVGDRDLHDAAVDFWNHTFYINGSPLPLLELVGWCRGLHNLRIMPAGPMYQSELLAEATSWDSCPGNHKYSDTELLPILDDDERREILREIHLESPGHESPIDVGYSYLSLILFDVVMAYARSSATLERLHLGDIRIVRSSSAIPRPDPFTSPPRVFSRLRYLSVHCTNVFVGSREDDESRNMFDGLFTHCPRLEFLEVPGIPPDPNVMQKILNPLWREISTYNSVDPPTNPPLSLTKVTLVTEVSHAEGAVLDAHLCCRLYVSQFASAGIELALVRKVED